MTDIQHVYCINCKNYHDDGTPDNYNLCVIDGNDPINASWQISRYDCLIKNINRNCPDFEVKENNNNE